MQRKNYSLIGAFSDEDATCLVRMILAETGVFLVLKSACYEKSMTYPALVSAIDELAGITEINGSPIDIEFTSTDILCNLNTTAKQYILNNTSQKLRIRNTVVEGYEHDMVMNALNVQNTGRLRVANDHDGVSGAIHTLQQWDKTKSENATHYSLVMSLLHSVGWVEGQLIKHQMV